MSVRESARREGDREGRLKEGVCVCAFERQNERGRVFVFASESKRRYLIHSNPCRHTLSEMVLRLRSNMEITGSTVKTSTRRTTYFCEILREYG